MIFDPSSCRFIQSIIVGFNVYPRERGAHVKILTGMFVLFFLGLKFGQILFFWVGKFLAIFLGFAKFPLFFVSDKFPAIFGSSNVFQVAASPPFLLL